MGQRKRIKNQSVRLIYKDNVIEVVNEFKYLGVLFDNCLKWDIHISKTVSKISRTISCIKRIKYYLPKRILKLLYDSLILSHIDYGIVLWGCSAKCHLEKLQKLQNRYARLILNVDILTPRIILLSSLRWQSVVQRVQYQFRIWMYKLINNKMPKYIKDIVCYRPINVYTRYATTCPLFIKKHKTEYFKRSFCYQGSVIWNTLPPSLRLLNSLDSFKKHCKLLFLT